MDAHVHLDMTIRYTALVWPALTPRARQRIRSPYKMAPGKAFGELVSELRLLRNTKARTIGSSLLLKRNGEPYLDALDKRAADPGVVVSWERLGKPFTLACDTFEKTWENLHAVGLCIGALRQIERSGATQLLERAWQGFEALPASVDAPRKRTWREVLGTLGVHMHPLVHPDRVRERYRELARELHPDRGGSDAAMAELNAAYEEALKELGVSR